MTPARVTVAALFVATAGATAGCYFGLPDVDPARIDSSKTKNRHHLQAYQRMGKKERAATPIAFRDMLLELARGCR